MKTRADKKTRTPLSVYFITKNEEDRIEKSLSKVIHLADEIIVVDSGSSDRTREIAEKIGAKVILNPWKGYSCQKAFAASQCKNDWVLDLDADEVLSDELIREIQTLFSNGPSDEYAAFKMKWVGVLPFDKKPRIGTPKKDIIRLYNRKRAQIVPTGEFSNDDRPKIKQGKVGKLNGLVYHYWMRSLDDVERKGVLLTGEQARYYLSVNKKYSAIRIYTEFPISFIKYYFFRRHFLGGWYGFVLAIMAAYRNTMRIAKWKELQESSLNRRRDHSSQNIP